MSKKIEMEEKLDLSRMTSKVVDKNLTNQFLKYY